MLRWVLRDGQSTSCFGFRRFNLPCPTSSTLPNVKDELAAYAALTICSRSVAEVLLAPAFFRFAVTLRGCDLPLTSLFSDHPHTVLSRFTVCGLCVRPGQGEIHDILCPMSMGDAVDREIAWANILPG